jgi:hypothetical protein
MQEQDKMFELINLNYISGFDIDNDYHIAIRNVIAAKEFNKYWNMSVDKYHYDFIKSRTYSENKKDSQAEKH